MGIIGRLIIPCLAALPARADPPTARHPRAADLCLPPPRQSATTDTQRALRDLVSNIEAIAPGEDPLLATLRARGTAI